jgi:phosphatidylethanolamine/phosphatidyl-N-methylethanolamine N-methyltransferase
MAPASRKLGWHPDFAIEDLLGPDDRARASFSPVPPAGLFTLVHLAN